MLCSVRTLGKTGHHLILKLAGRHHLQRLGYLGRIYMDRALLLPLPRGNPQTDPVSLPACPGAASPNKIL